MRCSKPHTDATAWSQRDRRCRACLGQVARGDSFAPSVGCNDRCSKVASKLQLESELTCARTIVMRVAGSDLLHRRAVLRPLNLCWLLGC